jgi:hypothetical protein
MRHAHTPISKASVHTSVCQDRHMVYTTYRAHRRRFLDFFLAPQAIGAVGKWESCFLDFHFSHRTQFFQPGLFG